MMFIIFISKPKSSFGRFSTAFVYNVNIKSLNTVHKDTFQLWRVSRLKNIFSFSTKYGSCRDAFLFQKHFNKLKHDQQGICSYNTIILKSLKSDLTFS